MTIPTLKRERSQETIQDESKHLKTDVTECSQKVANLIINKDIQEYSTPVVQSLLSESQSTNIGSVRFDKANGIVLIKLSNIDLCIASKQIGRGSINTARKAILINLSTFEITNENLKLKHTQPPIGKRPPRIDENSKHAFSLLQTIEHPHITPTPLFFDIVPTQFAMAKPVKIQYSIEPFFEHISNKYAFLSASEIQAFTQQISSALNYLHGKSIIHGDLRSDNIAIDNGKAILIDWDTMREVDPNKAATSLDDTSSNSFNSKDGKAIILDSTASESIQFGHVIHNWLHFYLKPGQGNEYFHIERDQIKGAPDEALCLSLYDQGQRLINGETLNAVFPKAAPTDLQA